MTFTLKEIGAVLPEFKPALRSGYPLGFNACRILSGQIQIELSREKLAKLIYEYEILTLQKVDVPWEVIMGKFIWYKKADALISKFPEWSEVKKT